MVAWKKVSSLKETTRLGKGPLHNTSAYGSPLWNDGDGQTGKDNPIEPHSDEVQQPAPDFEVNQPINQ